MLRRLEDNTNNEESQRMFDLAITSSKQIKALDAQEKFFRMNECRCSSGHGNGCPQGQARRSAGEYEVQAWGSQGICQGICQGHR